MFNCTILHVLPLFWDVLSNFYFLMFCHSRGVRALARAQIGRSIGRDTTTKRIYRLNVPCGLQIEPKSRISSKKQKKIKSTQNLLKRIVNHFFEKKQKTKVPSPVTPGGGSALQPLRFCNLGPGQGPDKH